jgi:hypothetical protein
LGIVARSHILYEEMKDFIPAWAIHYPHRGKIASVVPILEKGRKSVVYPIGFQLPDPSFALFARLPARYRADAPALNASESRRF